MHVIYKAHKEHGEKYYKILYRILTFENILYYTPIMICIDHKKSWLIRRLFLCILNT
jgi:hypothetical protein